MSVEVVMASECLSHQAVIPPFEPEQFFGACFLDLWPEELALSAGGQVFPSMIPLPRDEVIDISPKLTARDWNDWFHFLGLGVGGYFG